MLFKMFPVPLPLASWNSESSARFDISVPHPSIRDVHFKLGGSERDYESKMDWAYININLEREVLDGGDPNHK